MILVHGNDDLALTTGSNPIPIPGRYCHTPLGVQRDFGGPSKHNGSGRSGFALLARIPGATPISSHFFPLFNTIGSALRSVNNAYQFMVVLQGLRGKSVAQFGRKMAGIAQVKSIAYGIFFKNK
jgi:hypothetical protein